MAVTENEIQVQFSAADKGDLAGSGGTLTSDAIAASAAAWKHILSVNIVKDGAWTPAAGDTIECHLLRTTGDVDNADSDDEYPTDDDDGEWLFTYDTVNGLPAVVTVDAPLIPNSGGGKLYLINNAGASDDVDIYALLTEKLA